MSHEFTMATTKQSARHLTAPTVSQAMTSRQNVAATYRQYQSHTINIGHKTMSAAYENKTTRKNIVSYQNCTSATNKCLAECRERLAVDN